MKRFLRHRTEHQTFDCADALRAHHDQVALFVARFVDQHVRRIAESPFERAANPGSLDHRAGRGTGIHRELLTMLVDRVACKAMRLRLLYRILHIDENDRGITDLFGEVDRKLRRAIRSLRPIDRN